jgi:hypothetical protein
VVLLGNLAKRANNLLHHIVDRRRVVDWLMRCPDFVVGT